MQHSVSIVWFRLDLRLADNPALSAALNSSASVIPIYIYDDFHDKGFAPGAASRWWLHHSLKSLGDSLQSCGAKLAIRKGRSIDVIMRLLSESGATAVFFNQRYEPDYLALDAELEKKLRLENIEVRNFNSSLLIHPEKLRTNDGRPYKVFTPFLKRFSEIEMAELSIPAPERISFPKKELGTLQVEELKLLPAIDWASGLRQVWTPGEAAAQERLQTFLRESIDNYQTSRDRPYEDGVSMLSAHLHFGEISPRQICLAIDQLSHHKSPASTGRQIFKKELVWREFAHHILYHFPDTVEKPLQKKFESIPFSKNSVHLNSWQKGNTGFPIVDAGMRQLWQTGWMHNRVRMIVASFLTKDLLVSWTHGARWFWDTLVDADLANNTLGWQWTAGCGADAAPYFRIFNPERQGERFDPEGVYVRQWIPELAKLSVRYIHKPWKAPASELSLAGVELGKNYPFPLIDHDYARKRALQVFAELGQNRKPESQKQNKPGLVNQ